MVFSPGIYPASVTPMGSEGSLDVPGFLKLMAYFQSTGCQGVVFAGTNGEGPSLSAVEKRDLLREVCPSMPEFPVILGVATASLSEAEWSVRQAGKCGAAGILLMAPSYFREANESGLEAWFRTILDASPLPTLIYNFPQRTGIQLSAELMARLSHHPQMAGIKDSSGDRNNLVAYRQALDGHIGSLFVGDETLLIEALENGWSGAISGAANALSRWLCAIVQDFRKDQRESATAKFETVRPTLEFIRSLPQPAGNKAILHRLGRIRANAVRLPLTPLSDADNLLAELAESPLLA
jgi:4-hydroxy-tetrahydrodipicolinate synthase